MDKLGIFYANQTLCVLIHIRLKGDVGTMKTCLSPPVKYVLLTVPRRCFFCGSFLCLSCLLVFLLQPCDHLLEKG